jgi:catecholate siderophore receptor
MHKVERPTCIQQSRRRPAARLLSRFLAGSALGLVLAGPALAGEVVPAAEVQVAGAQPAPAPPPETVIIQGQRPEDFQVDVPSLNRLTQPLLDTPQTIDVIPESLLQDRAISSLNDALRAVPGVSLGAGEFSFQGNTPSIRGFVARTDMFLDGIRDFGNYYRDAFNLQQLEVLEGPSSILFGRGSTGGVINQVSKLPMLDPSLDAMVTLGSDMTRRATVDWNAPLPDLGEGGAFRITAMGHAAKVADRNVAKISRFGFSPSVATGIGTATRVTGAYFHQSANDVPDYGLPWYGSEVADVPRQNFYGFTSDYMKTTVDIGTAKFEHDFNTSVMLRNQLRYGYYTRDFRFTEPIVNAPPGTPLENINVIRNIFSGDSVETMWWNQTDATLHFNTGRIGHALIVGIEGGEETSSPIFFNSAGVPTTPLLTPNPDDPFTATSTFPRFDSHTTGTSFAAYIIDTLTLGERWEVNAAFRWDYFEADYSALRYNPVTGVGTPEAVLRVDRMPSYRGALVYKPAPNGSIYAAYGTSFNPSAESLNFIVTARAFAISNAELAPEENEAFEVGTKWNILNEQVSVTAAVFRLEKTNARVPNPTTPGFNSLDGVQRVDGFDFQLTGRVLENWQLSAGYTYLDSKIVESAPGGAPIGAPLLNAPKHSVAVFTEWLISERFEIGGGLNYQSTRYAQNVPPVKKVPGYFTADLMAKYFFNDQWSLQLNVNNVFDKFYYQQVHPFHVVPGAGRTVLLTLNFQS